MHAAPVIRLVGLFCMGFSLTLWLPLLIGLWFRDGEAPRFFEAWTVDFTIGALLWFAGRSQGGELSNRDGFLVVALFWFVLCAMAATPFLLSGQLTPVDAFFEAASGLTTTGATILPRIEGLPESLLFYRQFIQWLGGMGLVVLAVAVLPFLGIGGAQLYRSEAPGPLKEERMTPRLTHTARSLWYIYLGLTLGCAVSYWLAGMSWFDAVNHSLATVSTGGFSTYDDSIAHFHSAAVETVAVAFMTLGAINFAVHFLAWRYMDARYYWQNPEVRTFIFFIFGTSMVGALLLHDHGTYASWLDDFRYATFEVVSVITSTGFGTADFSHWPDFLPVLLIFISFVGGCGGSTAGGMKVLRIQLIVLQGYQEIRRLIHPHALLRVRIGRQVVPEKVITGVWGYFAAYVIVFAVLMLAIMHAGLDQVSAFSAIATSMNNLGPGLGRVAVSFADVSDSAKTIAAFAMILGRLEIFTIVVLLTPEFWRN